MIQQIKYIVEKCKQTQFSYKETYSSGKKKPYVVNEIKTVNLSHGFRVPVLILSLG